MCNFVTTMFSAKFSSFTELSILKNRSSFIRELLMSEQNEFDIWIQRTKTLKLLVRISDKLRFSQNEWHSVILYSFYLQQ